MAWIYLAESAESDLHSNHGSEPSLIVKETDMLNPCCCREWPLMTSTELQSGTTLHRSAGPCFQKSTSSSGDSPARTSALQEMERAWAESEAAFSSRSCAWPKKSSPSSYSLKMSRQLELVDSTSLPSHWPASGMIVDGTLYPLQKSELSICVSDGSFLPTPTASDYGKNNGRNTLNARDRYSLTTIARHNLWPTPKASDSNPCGAQAMLRYNERTGRKTLITEVAKTTTGGQLNPTWVEWLMGYKCEWTALDASVTQWFRSKRGKRSCV